MSDLSPGLFATDAGAPMPALPTLRTCLTAPIEELRAATELPFAVVDRVRLAPLPAPARAALERDARGLGPGRRELSLAVARALGRDTPVSRLIRRELGLSAALLRDLTRRDLETVRLSRGARVLAERAGGALKILDGAMAGVCARALAVAAELGRALRDPAERARLGALLEGGRAPLPGLAARQGEAARHARRLRTLARMKKARLAEARARLRQERAERRAARSAKTDAPGGAT